MNIQRLKDQHLKELRSWVESLEDLPLPSTVTPKNLHDYPRCIEIADKMKRFCQDMSKSLKAEILESEDSVMSVIESERYILRTSRLGVHEYRKTYTTADAREREMRKRLADDPLYPIKKQEQSDWEQMSKDWGSHSSKLHRELRILESDFLHTGTTNINISPEFKK